MSTQSPLPPLRNRRPAFVRTHDSAAPMDVGLPRAGDVALEIGLLLAVHLAIVAAVAWTLMATGVV